MVCQRVLFEPMILSEPSLDDRVKNLGSGAEIKDIPDI
jgi:hypothetical protein